MNKSMKILLISGITAVSLIVAVLIFNPFNNSKNIVGDKEIAKKDELPSTLDNTNEHKKPMPTEDSNPKDDNTKNENQNVNNKNNVATSPKKKSSTNIINKNEDEKKDTIPKNNEKYSNDKKQNNERFVDDDNMANQPNHIDSNKYDFEEAKNKEDKKDPIDNKMNVNNDDNNIANSPTPPEPKERTISPSNNKTSNDTSVSISSDYQKEVIRLVNIERNKVGARNLILDTELHDIATKKCQDMVNRGYFDHNSPTYGSPFDMLKKFGVTYKSAGENIAMGQKTPKEVVVAWMNSKGHRENILNPSFTNIGVGTAKDNDSSLYWTQLFIGR